MQTKALWASVALAILGAVLLWVYTERFEQQARGGVPVRVVVAAQDIPVGARLRRDMLVLKEIPRNYLEPRHITAADLNRIVGLPVRTALRPNESILWTDLAAGAEGARGLSSLVRPGYRAYTIRVGSGGALGGLLQPGDRVDVLHTVVRGGKMATVTLLQNVLVLAVGGRTASSGGAPAPEEDLRGSGEVTVSVTPEQAQLLALARRTGRLDLVLRAPDDIALLEGLPETTPEDLLRAERRVRLQRRVRLAPAEPSGPERVR